MSSLDLVRSFDDRIIFIDTETTGLKPENDEVLSLSVVSASGEVLFDHLIKPRSRKRWPNAQEIHGISPADVKDEKTLEEYSPELATLFDGSYLIVGYNVKFDLEMLKASGLDVSKCKSFDVMREFENVHGHRVKLSECAYALGYGSFDAHGSLEDAKATAYCFGVLVADVRYTAVCEQASRGLSSESRTAVAAVSGSGCVIPMAISVFVLVFVVIVLAVI